MTRVDVHTHLAPLFDGRSGAYPGGLTVTGDGRHELSGAKVGPAGLYQPDALEAYLDRAGLDAAMVAVPPPYFGQRLDRADSQRWAAAVNDGLLARLDGRPRLRGLAFLPLHEPDAALAEYRRIRGTGPWWGVTAGAGGRAPSLADPAYAPLWRALADDAGTLLLHPAASTDARLDEFYLGNLLGNPVETAVAVAQLVFGDVVARYPALRLVLVHGGGVVPAVAGRWTRGVATDRPGVQPLGLPPGEALRRIWIDCLTHDPAVTRLAWQIFGTDRLLLGSDWPFPMGTDEPAATIGDAELAHRAATDNAAAAFGNAG